VGELEISRGRKMIDQCYGACTFISCLADLGLDVIRILKHLSMNG
jgi:hypothetical protein